VGDPHHPAVQRIGHHDLPLQVDCHTYRSTEFRVEHHARIRPLIAGCQVTQWVKQFDQIMACIGDNYPAMIDGSLLRV